MKNTNLIAFTVHCLFLTGQLKLYLQVYVEVPRTVSTHDHSEEMVIWKNTNIKHYVHQGGATFYTWIPAEMKTLLNDKKRSFMSGKRQSVVGTKEGKEEHHRGWKWLQKEGQSAAKECEEMCKGLKNISGYKKSNSRQSENMPPRLSLASLEEKKMMGPLSAITDDTSHPS